MGFGCGNHVGSPCTALKVMHTPRILMTTAMTAGANVNKRRIHAPRFQHHRLKSFPRDRIIAHDQPNQAIHRRRAGVAQGRERLPVAFGDGLQQPNRVGRRLCQDRLRSRVLFQSGLIRSASRSGLVSCLT